MFPARTALLLFALCRLASAQEIAATHAAPASGTHTCPVDSRPLSSAEIAEFKRDFMSAHRQFRGVADQDPQNLGAAADAVDVLIAWRHMDDASKEAADLIQAHPNDSIALSTQAEVSWYRGDVASATSALSRSMNADPCNYRALALAAEIEMAAGQGDSAANHAQLAHQISSLRVAEIWAETRPADQRASAYQVIADSTPDQADRRKAGLTADALATQLALAAKCTVKAERSPVTIPLFRQDHHLTATQTLWGMPVELSVKINDHSKAISLVDGDWIKLSRAAAKELGIKSWTTIYKNVGIGDPNLDMSMATLDSLKIGDLEYRNCPVMIANSDYVAGSEIPVSYFADFLMAFDFSAMNLTLTPLPPGPEVSESHWSHVAMDRAEHQSINAGSWPLQRSARPRELNDWVSIYQMYPGGIFIPVHIDPDHMRLFRLDPYMPHEEVSTLTAKASIPVANWAGIDKKTQGALGAPYAIQFGKVIRPVQSWVVSSSIYAGGLLGYESLAQTKISLDLRDNLGSFERSQKR